MNHYPINLFRTSCGATGPLELNVSGPGWAGGQRRIFDQPFILVGRDERNSLRLEDAAVSRRHAYLHLLGGRVFCVDLGSRHGTHWGGERRPAGWLCPDQGIQIGPFTLESAMAAQAGGGQRDEVESDWDPLQDRANDPHLLPWITVEGDGIGQARMCLNRGLVLVGSSPACRIRLREAVISRYHCSLVRTAEGVWLIDLLSRTGTCLNDEPVRWALVKEGDRLRVGPYVLGVWYQTVGTQTPSTRPPEIRAETPVQSADGKSESVPPGSFPAQALVVRCVEPSATEISTLASAQPAEPGEAREHQGEAEALGQQLADSQAECDRLREQARVFKIQVAEVDGLQTRLEAVCAERDSWRSEAQAHQTRIASDSAEREELRQRLEAAQLQHIKASNAEYDAALYRLQEILDALARSQDEARSLQVELDQARERQQDAETLRQQLAGSQAECGRLREQAGMVEAQLAEAAGLQARLAAAEAKARELEAVCAERDSWRSEVQALQSRIASDSSEREGLRQRLEAAQQQLAAERDAVGAVGLRLEKESATVQQMRADFTARNAEYDVAVQRLQEILDELDRSQDEARSLQAELEQAHERQRDAQTLRQRLEDAQAKHDQLCARVPELEGRATSAERLRSQLRNAEEEMEQLRAQLREAESRMADREDMRAECVRHREQARVFEIRVAEVAGLQTQLEAAQAKAREIEAVCAERDCWRSKAQALQSRIAADSSDREELRQRLGAAQQQLAAERDAVRTAGLRLEKESATVQQVRADFTARNAAYDAALQRLQEIQDALARSQDEARSLQNKLGQAHERQREAEVFGQQLADSQGECVRLREQVRALKLQVAEAARLQARLEVVEANARQLEAACTEGEQWQAQAQALQTRLASLSAEREEWQHQFEAAQQQLVEERADLAARNAEASAALQGLQETQEELSRSRDEARGLQAELDQAREHLRDAEALRQQLAVTRAKHDQLCAHVPELEGRAASADRLWDQLRAADAEMEHLRVQLREAGSRMADRENIRAECVRLRDQARTLEIQVAEAGGLQARLEAAQAKARQMEVLCAERDRLQNEAHALQTRIASDSGKREELQQRLEAAQQQLAAERDAVRAAGLRLEKESATVQQVRTDFAARNAEHDIALQRLQEIQDALARSQDEARSLQAELDQAHERQRDAQTLRRQLAGSQAECDRLRDRACTIEAQLAEAVGLQAQLEAAQAKARELEAVCAERDRWQNKAQNLQTRIASDSTKQEQLDHLAADLHAAQVERDRLYTQQQASQQLVEQACTRVTELERVLADAAAAQDRAIAEARAGWESERQALEARLEQERQANNGATQAAIHDVEVRAASEREGWRQRIEDAEKQIIRERKLFQEQNEQFRQQSAVLQSERDHLAARLSQVELSNPAAEARPRNEAWVSDYEFFSARRLADQSRPHLPRERAWGQTDEPASVSAVEPEAGGEETVEQRSAPATPPAAETDTGEASLPSGAPQDAPAALEGRQPGEDLPPWYHQQADLERKRLWRKFLNFVLRK